MVFIPAEEPLPTGICCCTWLKNMQDVKWPSWRQKYMPLKLTERVSRHLSCLTDKRSMWTSRSKKLRIISSPRCPKESPYVSSLSNLQLGDGILNDVSRKRPIIRRSNISSV